MIKILIDFLEILIHTIDQHFNQGNRILQLIPLMIININKNLNITSIFLNMTTNQQMNNAKLSMNLPVNSHIDRLQSLIQQMYSDMEDSQKQLHMLRGAITQLSYISKDANLELNRFLVENIASIKKQLLGIHKQQKQQLKDMRIRVNKLEIDQEDICADISHKSENIEQILNKVGLSNIN